MRTIRRIISRICIAAMVLWSLYCLSVAGKISSVPTTGNDLSNSFAYIGMAVGWLTTLNVWFIGFASMGITALLLRPAPLLEVTSQVVKPSPKPLSPSIKPPIPKKEETKALIGLTGLRESP